MAFWFFLSLVPLLVLAGFLIGQVARMRGMDALTGPLLDVVPGTAQDLVRAEIERLAGSHASSIAPLGVVGFMWTASSGLHNLMDVFELAVSARRQAWWVQRAMALGWVMVGLATACVLAVVIVKVGSLVEPQDVAASAVPSSSSLLLKPRPVSWMRFLRPICASSMSNLPFRSKRLSRLAHL